MAGPDSRRVEFDGELDAAAAISIAETADAPDPITQRENDAYAVETAKAMSAGKRADLEACRRETAYKDHVKCLEARGSELAAEIKTLRATCTSRENDCMRLAQLEQAYSGSVEFFWISNCLNGAGGIIMALSGAFENTQYQAIQPVLLWGGGAMILVGLFIGYKNASVNRPKYHRQST